MIRIFLLVLILAIGLPTVFADDGETLPSEKFFFEQVEPILQSHCFACHSHAAGEMSGGLTLDSRSGWQTGGDHGAAVIPGKVEESLLLRAVQHAGDIKMPPESKLASSEIQILKRWVAGGAIDPRIAPSAESLRGDSLDWWSLKPLVRPKIPKIYATENAHPIDAFVRAQLSKHGLEPSPPASPETLVRRLYIDLHGIQPTPEELTANARAQTNQSYKSLIDMLLASPHYGQRWARHWLDTVHFADTHGCEHDIKRPNAWRYRDYVIESLNADTPWSRFVREQLAADAFFPEQTKLIPALGFISAGPLESSRAATAPVTFDYLDRDDMVSQTMAAFTSTTVGCARCHHHKFDPISQEDYYSLQAVFAGASRGDRPFDPDPAVARIRKELVSLIDACQSKDEAVLFQQDNHARVAEWLARRKEHSVNWTTFLPDVFVASGGAILQRQDDGSMLATGNVAEKENYTISGTTELKKISSIRIDVIPDDRLPMKGPGRCGNGNLHLSEVEILLFEPGASEPKKLQIATAAADWNQDGWTIQHAIDGNLKTAWGIYPKVAMPHVAVFDLKESTTLKSGSRIAIHLRQLHPGHPIGRFKLSLSDVAGASEQLLPGDIEDAVGLKPADRSREQKLAIASEVLKRMAQRKFSELPEQQRAYAFTRYYLRDKPVSEPVKTSVVHVLNRGNIQKPGAVALPGTLSIFDSSANHDLNSRFVLQDSDDEASGRAALADWIVNSDNPLTWRSIVNRVWFYHFGRGICNTPNDIGRMGESPSHPELLDWLAVWFRDDAKGSLKDLHRLILTSDAWKQQSTPPKELAKLGSEIDRDNRFLWRMNSRPIDAETFRDSVLAMSGRLDWTHGGPGVEQFVKSKGPQATPSLDYEAYDWSHPGASRRSIYRVVWRGISDPFMESMGFPDLGLLNAKRSQDVSPLQSLAMLNNPFVMHHSIVLTDRLREDSGDLSEQVKRAFWLTHLRSPTDSELNWLNHHARRHGLTSVCRILFNSNEFLFVD